MNNEFFGNTIYPEEAKTGYKILDRSLCSLTYNFQYEIGNTYKSEEKPAIARCGFHIYTAASAVLYFLASRFLSEPSLCDPYKLRIVTATVWGDTQENKRDASACGSCISILSETSLEELVMWARMEMNSGVQCTGKSFLANVKRQMFVFSCSHRMLLLEYPLSVAYLWGNNCNAISKSELAFVHVKGNKNTVVTQLKGAHIIVVGESNGNTIISNGPNARIKVFGRGTRVISNGDFAQIDVDAPDVQVISSGACPSFRFKPWGHLVSLVADVKNNNRFKIVDKDLYTFDGNTADEWFHIGIDGKLEKGRSCGMNGDIWKLIHKKKNEGAETFYKERQGQV